jgi:hypothetical protein
LKRGSFGHLFVDPFHGHVVVQQGRVVVVDLVLVDLQPVAVEDVGKRYETVAFRQQVTVKDREWRLLVRRAHVGEHDAVALERRISALAHGLL